MLTKERHQTVLSDLLITLGGIWLVVSPLVLGYPKIITALVNNVVLGLAIAAFSLSRIFSPPTAVWSSWVSIVLGFWLLISPFVLGYLEPLPKWNDIFLGAVIIILGGFGTAPI